MDLKNNNDNNILDSRAFVAPRSILEMYQKVSFPSFKIWASILSDITEKQYSDQDQFLPLSVIWQTLDGRLSHKRLEKHLDELQTTLIKKNEYLPQVNAREINSFTMLGPTTITVNESNDVTSLKYRIVKELISILKDEVNKEKFVIEMKTFISLKGEGGEHAKNLVLFCTPYVHTGASAWVTIEQLREFMGLKDRYLDYRVFNRDVIKKAIKTISANPYIAFDITNVEVRREGRSVNEIRFLLQERKSIKNLLASNIDDHRSPLSPDKLRNMLVTYWCEKTKDNHLSYAHDILVDLLKQFRLVDKYINEAISEEAYHVNPVQETFRIFSIATAITQLWLDGKLQKEDSKIYNYAYRIFMNPNQNQIESLCQKFLAGADIRLPDEKVNSKALKEAKASQLFHVEMIEKSIRRYDKLRFERTLANFTKEQIYEIDQEFIQSAKLGRFGTWAKKAVLAIEDPSTPLLSVLTRRTLLLYKNYMTNKGMSAGSISEKSTVDFLTLFPDLRRYTAILNIPEETPYLTFENTLEDIKNRSSL